MIASFYKPTKGTIFYSKRKLEKDIKNIKRIFGLSIEDGSFYENLTVKENLYYFARLYGIKNKILKKRAKILMNFVGLYSAKDVLAKDLSLGMKKRLDIACGYIHSPKVLILDEPTADLDPLLRKQIIHLVKKINSYGTTVVFTTQLLEEAEKLCDKLAILYNEKIIEEDEVEKIKSKYDSKDLNQVFNKIFSKKGRKTYQESKDQKTKLDSKKREEIEKIEEVVEKSLKNQNVD
jgi:ABC-2 type transport system ATP-binding protein